MNDHVAHSVISSPVKLKGRDGREYSAHPLTKLYASAHAASLAAIHKLIPYVGPKPGPLLADRDVDGQQFPYKWEISLAIEHRGRPIGFLMAYARDFSSRHPMRSVYIHRMAVARPHQRNFVGIQLLATALSLYFDAMPWLLTVTIQTNEEPRNAPVLAFYRRAGFRHCHRVEYPEKVDSLMEFERTNSTGPGAAIPGFEDLRIPPRPPVASRLPNPFGSPANLEAPVVHFGTTSQEKLVQYRYLLRSYGVRLRRLQHSISLTEPQIDTQGPSAESALVSGPLKLFSRFAARNTAFPVMVEDTMLFIEHFNEDYTGRPMLPGPDTKRWWLALGAEGVLRLLGASPRRAARYVCQIGINYGPGQYEYFRQELLGTIADAIRISPEAEGSFPYTNPTFFHRIFIPQGSTITLAEMDSNEFLSFDYRRACLAQALPLLRRYGAVEPQLRLFAG